MASIKQGRFQQSWRTGKGTRVDVVSFKRSVKREVMKEKSLPGLPDYLSKHRSIVEIISVRISAKTALAASILV